MFERLSLNKEMKTVASRTDERAPLIRPCSPLPDPMAAAAAVASVRRLLFLFWPCTHTERCERGREGGRATAEERKTEQTALLPFHSRRASSSLVRVYPNETGEGRSRRKTVFAINLIEVFVLQEIKSGNQQEGLWKLACSLAARPSRHVQSTLGK